MPFHCRLLPVNNGIWRYLLNNIRKNSYNGSKRKQSGKTIIYLSEIEPNTKQHVQIPKDTTPYVLVRREKMRRTGNTTCSVPMTIFRIRLGKLTAETWLRELATRPRCERKAREKQNKSTLYRNDCRLPAR